METLLEQSTLICISTEMLLSLGQRRVRSRKQLQPWPERHVASSRLLNPDHCRAGIRNKDCFPADPLSSSSQSYHGDVSRAETLQSQSPLPWRRIARNVPWFLVFSEEFMRAVYVATDIKLTQHVVNTVFKIFDEDHDDKLSHKEFIGVMKDRLHRGGMVRGQRYKKVFFKWEYLCVIHHQGLKDGHRWDLTGWKGEETRQIQARCWEEERVYCENTAIWHS